jgi:hypothetical protein
MLASWWGCQEGVELTGRGLKVPTCLDVSLPVRSTGRLHNLLDELVSAKRNERTALQEKRTYSS